MSTTVGDANYAMVEGNASLSTPPSESNMLLAKQITRGKRRLNSNNITINGC